jgi:hypothetical protein
VVDVSDVTLNNNNYESKAATTTFENYLELEKTGDGATLFNDALKNNNAITVEQLQIKNYTTVNEINKNVAIGGENQFVNNSIDDDHFKNNQQFQTVLIYMILNNKK